MAVKVGGPQIDVSAVAVSDLSSSQYCAVVFSLVGGVLSCDLPGATGAKVDGILQNAPTAGQVAQVRILGGTFMRANAAITAPADVVATASNGRVATGAATNRRLGRVLETSTAAGDFISGIVMPDGTI